MKPLKIKLTSHQEAALKIGLPLEKAVFCSEKNRALLDSLFNLREEKKAEGKTPSQEELEDRFDRTFAELKKMRSFSSDKFRSLFKPAKSKFTVIKGGDAKTEVGELIAAASEEKPSSAVGTPSAETASSLSGIKRRR